MSLNIGLWTTIRDDIGIKRIINDKDNPIRYKLHVLNIQRSIENNGVIFKTRNSYFKRIK